MLSQNMSNHILLEVMFEPSGKKPTSFTYKTTDLVSIGRDKENMLHCRHDFVSRHHGALYRLNTKWFFEDFSSLGSFIERQGRRSAIHNKRVEVFQGDKLIIEFDQGKGSYLSRYTIVLKQL